MHFVGTKILDFSNPIKEKTNWYIAYGLWMVNTLLALITLVSFNTSFTNKYGN